MNTIADERTLQQALESVNFLFVGYLLEVCAKMGTHLVKRR
jgi:hypothetical protein